MNNNNNKFCMTTKGCVGPSDEWQKLSRQDYLLNATVHYDNLYLLSNFSKQCGSIKLFTDERKITLVQVLVGVGKADPQITGDACRHRSESHLKTLKEK